MAAGTKAASTKIGGRLETDLKAPYGYEWQLIENSPRHRSGTFDKDILNTSLPPNPANATAKYVAFSLYRSITLLFPLAAKTKVVARLLISWHRYKNMSLSRNIEEANLIEMRMWSLFSRALLTYVAQDKRESTTLPSKSKNPIQSSTNE
ncbi:hypothetical protein EVAR_32442_1 [Eumeta japonica]|uniref:Uncharacterized protein n=1 Tax=Eumeta variegata TaxID=151549 RepID=A0A4C1VMX9_EUMVA|nr:hypothetical protein EVAR_32442_1 [Eumeta japonica]